MSGRLEKSVVEMAEFCPDFGYRPLPGVAGGGGQWKGTIRPAPLGNPDELEKLLDDIHHHHPVYGAPNGELRHLSTCTAQHCRHSWMDQIHDLRVEFSVLIFYSGGRDHPRCWVLSPEIPPAKRRHFWNDGSICPFLASDNSWVWDRHTVADFVPHVSVWLLVWLVYDQTDVWIVGEHEGSAQYHLSVISPSDQCWCRSGRKYFKCHLKEDELAAMRFRIRQ
ncbi:MAG: SEC-C domain-containing protein [Acidobacteria bacterium]|nr:SEC-C domain-containing protein [Acidobacteriota bacterium]